MTREVPMIDLRDRRTWHVNHLDIVDEPMALSMIKYRGYEDRHESIQDANVVSSHLRGSRKRRPIIDLDYSHQYAPSSTDGHAHLYLNVEISRWREIVLLIGLYVGRVIEPGYFWWSLRRGGTFVRRPGVRKTVAEGSVRYTHGMFFKSRGEKQ